MTWTLEKLLENNPGAIVDGQPIAAAIAETREKGGTRAISSEKDSRHLSGNMSALERRFWALWKTLGGPRLEREYRFHHERGWRLDAAQVDCKVAIELEGGVWSNGRHTRGKGFIEDCRKYNQANLLGWHVFRLPTGFDDSEVVDIVDFTWGLLNE